MTSSAVLPATSANCPAGTHAVMCNKQATLYFRGLGPVGQYPVLSESGNLPFAESGSLPYPALSESGSLQAGLHDGLLHPV